MEAVRCGSINAVKKLLELGADVYQKDKHGTTALDVAKLTENEECAQMISEHISMLRVRRQSAWEYFQLHVWDASGSSDTDIRDSFREWKRNGYQGFH